MNSRRICFFSTVKKEKLQFESYSIQDIEILKSLGYEIVIADSFWEIPFNCDLYFSWWTSGSVFPLIISSITRKPLICIAGGTEAIIYNDSIDNSGAGYNSSHFVKKIATRLVLKFATCVVIVSEFMLDSVRKLGARNVEIIHNGVDVIKFDKSLSKSNYFLSVFNFEEHVIKLKRGYLLVEAFAEFVKIVPDQKLILIGKAGNGLEKFKKQVESLNLNDNIVILNILPNDDFVKLVKNASLYIQISDVESFGMSIAEAMSCEVPVLVSCRGAIPELVGPVGIYVDNNSSNSIFKGLVQYSQLSENKRNLMGFELRKRIVKNYSLEIRKNKLIKLINSILDV